MSGWNRADLEVDGGGAVTIVRIRDELEVEVVVEVVATDMCRGGR